jgi:transglutaminase-like putative cysteine protease
MRIVSGPCLALVLAVSPVLADAPKGRTVLDSWEAAYLTSGKAGYFRTNVVEIDRDGQKVLRSTFEMNLTLKRFRDTINLRAQVGSEETPDGKVTAVFMRHYLGKQQQLAIVGKVVGKRLHLTHVGRGPLKSAPWDDRVISLYRQRLLFQERKVKPGDSFDFLSFEPTINLVVKNRVRVKDYEEVTVPGRGKQRLLKVEIKPDEIRIDKPDGSVDRFQGPTLYAWLDKNRMPARTQTDMPGLGTITTYRSTGKQAKTAGNLATITDLGISQMVLLAQRIRRPLDAKVAVYRITLKGDKDAVSAFRRDARQTVLRSKGDTFDMRVTASRGPVRKKGEQAEEIVGAEYLKSCYFINSEDREVRRLARQAVGREKDPWKKALRIERWVHGHMKVTFDEEMATADHVARTLEGDCTEHAMLAAAMCRAEGVPSRTALGMIYADTGKGPAMVFHMWTEVWIEGQWVPIDATLGRGYVGADHLKVSDQSWHDTRTLTPLLPFLRVVGKVAIEVVSVK